MLTAEDAVREVKRLSRMGNYPTDREGVMGLARGLQRAAGSQEQARSIVDRCLELSAFCPTDFDLLAVARELNPQPAEPSWTPDVARCPAGRCDGHGWAQAWYLITSEGSGNHAYQRRERITREVYAELCGKVDTNQRVYETVEPCSCRPTPSAPEQRQLAAGEKA